jgi:NAD(P)-dependent dehydrogenase (short-subunit alcohol dehydrogenase family)
MSMRLPGIEGLHVVYTGAAGLIGSGACRELARQGAKLTLVDPDREGLSRLVASLRDLGVKYEVNVESELDLLDTTAVDRFIGRIESDSGPVGCLINSAYPRTPDWHLGFESIPLGSWQENVNSHMNSYFHLSQRVALRMIPRRSGNVINFGSIYGVTGPDFSVYEGLGHMTMPAAYAAIKGGIINFTRYMAAYLGPHGIRVNAISPGGVENGQDPRFVEHYCARTPLRRMACVEDIVGPLVFLVSDLSRYMSGVNLMVDGGWTAI